MPSGRPESENSTGAASPSAAALHDLLAALLRAAAGLDRCAARSVRSCVASAVAAGRGEFGVDLQQAAGREFLAREPQRAEREIVRLLDADVDQVDARAGQLVEPRLEGGERVGRPVGAGQVGEHIDFAAVVGLQLEPIDRVAERVFERPDDGAGVEPLDAAARPRLCRSRGRRSGWPDRRRSPGRRPATVRAATRPARGPFRAASGSRARTSSAASCRTRAPPRSGCLPCRPRPSRAASAGRARTPSRQMTAHRSAKQQQLPQPQPMLIDRLPLLHEPQRRKHELLHLAPHDQMQHDRHADQERRHSWCDKAHRVEELTQETQRSSDEEMQTCAVDDNLRDSALMPRTLCRILSPATAASPNTPSAPGRTACWCRAARSRCRSESTRGGTSRGTASISCK